jgi:preprotein translocase subunit SecG
MKAVQIILIVLEVIVSVVLTAVVLMQSGKEAGLGALAGNSESYMNKSKMGGLDKKLASATKWIALAWIVLTLVLTLVYA